MAPISVLGRMIEGGVAFADGIEQDFVHFDWGRRLEISSAACILNLVVA